MLLEKIWLRRILLILLFMMAAAGIILARFRYVTSLPIEISMSPPVSSPGGTIYIDGSIVVPGYYPFTSEDTINDLVQAAGGIKDQADLSHVDIYIHPLHDNHYQKVNINHADLWLLQALPGIGETLAERIVDYRLQNGPFPDTNSIKNISGIGESEFNRIKELITVNGD